MIFLFYSVNVMNYFNSFVFSLPEPSFFNGPYLIIIYVLNKLLNSDS